jgi:hypothetical protein
MGPSRSGPIELPPSVARQLKASARSQKTIALTRVRAVTELLTAQELRTRRLERIEREVQTDPGTMP